MKGKKSPKPKTMDELTQKYESSTENSVGGDVTQADFEKALKAVSQKKAPKGDGKSTDSSAD